MYTVKACLYLTLTISLLAFSVLYRSGRLAALTVPLVLMAGLSSLLFKAKAKVRVERLVESREVFTGEEVLVKLKVASGDGACLIELVDNSSRMLSITRGNNRAMLHLAGTEELEYIVRPLSRGRYKIGPTVIRLTDPMGLWKIDDVVCEEEEVVAFPHFSDIGEVPLRAGYTGVWPGEVPSRRSGRGTEFYGVREYVPGDELRRVNWKASARLCRLMSNEFVEERVTDVLIVVDAGWSGIVEDELARDVLEREVSAAAALALALLRAGNRVGLLTRGEGGAWLKPGFGRRQLLGILYCLAGLSMGEQMPLSYVLRSIAHYLLKPNAQIILISPLLDRDAVLAVQEVAGEYEVLVISPNPFVNLEAELSPAHKIIELEREVVLEALSRTCRVIDWSPQAPLAPLLRRVRVGGWLR